MKYKIGFLTLLLSFCVFFNNVYAILKIDESEAKASLFTETEKTGEYKSTIEFYKNDNILYESENIETLEYLITLPVNILVEKINYEVSSEYMIVEESLTDEQMNDASYGFLRLKVSKKAYLDDDSDNNQKVLTINIISNKKDLCSSKLTVATYKEQDSQDKTNLKISAVVQKNALNVISNYIIGFDNQNYRLAGIYYDKNAEYIDLPISVFKDRCSTPESGLLNFTNISGMIQNSEELEIESVSEENKEISEITFEKDSKTFNLDYKTRDVPSGFIIRFKRKDLTKATNYIGSVSIGTYELEGVEYGGGVFQYLLIPGLLGDWDLNEEISLSDVIRARKFVAKVEDDYFLNGLEDINKDGKISIADVIPLRKIIVESDT